MTVSKIDKAISEWLKRYGDNTRDGYRRDLNQFRTWHNGPLLKATRSDVQDWIAHLADTYGNDTVLRKVSAVSSFYTYCIQEELTDRNPAAHTRRPTSGGHVRLGLSDIETERLLDTAADHSTAAYLICASLTLTGMRISELCNANLEDLGTDSGVTTLAIKRKGGRIHRIRYPEGLVDLVLAEAAHRKTGPLIAGPRGGRIDRHRANHIVREVGSAAGLDAHPHLLRHTAATLAVRDGAKLEEVQDMLGHADPKTTRRYIRAVNAIDNSPSTRLADRFLNRTPTKAAVLTRDT